MHALNKNIIKFKLCYLPVELWCLLNILVLSLIGTIYFSCRIHYLTFYNKVSVFISLMRWPKMSSKVGIKF